MPPRPAKAFNTPSDVLRLVRRHQDGLACVTATGRSESSMASRVVRYPEWGISITLPRRFISRVASRPIRVIPLSCSSIQPQPSSD